MTRSTIQSIQSRNESKSESESKSKSKEISKEQTLNESGILKNYKLSSSPFHEFLKNQKIKFVSKTENFLEFDLVNSHPSLANALRRIIMAELPTIAIHEVTIYENSSIFPDEYLSHRLGMIPLLLREKSETEKESGTVMDSAVMVSDTVMDSVVMVSDTVMDIVKESYNTLSNTKIKLALNVENNSSEVKFVYSQDLKLVEIDSVGIDDKIDSVGIDNNIDSVDGNDLLSGHPSHNNIHPCHSNIHPCHKTNTLHVKPNVLICKLAPGHKIQMTMTTEQGTGSLHAKWSPVSLCTYRLLPKILIEGEITGEDAFELQKCFSPGVIEVISEIEVVNGNGKESENQKESAERESENWKGEGENGKGRNRESKGRNVRNRNTPHNATHPQQNTTHPLLPSHSYRAVVVNPRLDQMSREVLRHKKFEGSVKLLREEGHFCFQIETILEDPVVILKRALRKLEEKAKELRGLIEEQAAIEEERE